MLDTSPISSSSSSSSSSIASIASIVTVLHCVSSTVDTVDKEESILAHDLKNPRGYHWDTSDWMPSVQLPGIKEFPQYEVVEPPAPLYTDPSAMDTDYYPGGFDIESGFPPPPEDFPLSEDLPPPPPLLPEFDTLRPRNLEPPNLSLTASQGVRQRPALPHLYSLNRYLPQHSYASDGGEVDGQGSGSTSAGSSPPSTAAPLRGGFSLDPSVLDNVSLSMYASTASCSDMSACCEESEVMLSDYDSGEEEGEDPLESLVIPDSQHQHQQHTQV